MKDKDALRRRVDAEIHSIGSPPLAIGDADLSVGGCLLYDGGPHVLLTVDQRGNRHLELAITQPEAELLVAKLKQAIASWCKPRS